MADPSGDKILNNGVEVAQNPQAVDYTTGMEATEAQGLVTVKVKSSGIGTTQLATGAVTLAKLAAGITPSHVVKYAGTFTTAGGDANESIAVTGVAATDIVAVTLRVKGATPRTILTAVPATNAINVEMSGDPSTDHVLQYIVYRAAA